MSWRGKRSLRKQVVRKCFGTSSDAEDTTFAPVPGHGTIYAYTIMYHGPAFCGAVPYASLIVELDEAPGALLMGNLLDAPCTAAKVGCCVEVVFHKLNEDITLQQFRLEEDEA
jgi:uncharacterized OB-fold protein